MSYELKMQGVGSGKRSRLYKKTKRASMNKIDATHLPMRVQSDKGSYWGQTSRGLVHIPYSKIRKFLMARVGRPVDKVYSEFLQEGSKYAQIRNLQEVFNEFIHQRDNYANRGLKLGGFYVSNDILNYKASKKRVELFNRSHIEYNRSHFPDSETMKNVTLVLGIRGPQLLTKMWVVVKGNLMLLPVYLVSSVRWESLQDPNDKAIGIYGKKAVEQLKEFVIAKVVGYGSQYAVTVWKSSTYKNWSISNYYYYVVKISDIETYKKEKYKL